ncbi:MAG: MoaD/ThiS family protein [Spirochaetes bacterium]|nr:MoaD/ThiS family protein [Spirochaetota bacterium]
MGRKKNLPATVPVELKIIGFFGGSYVHLITPADAPEGGTLTGLLHLSFLSGRIEKGLYRALKRGGRGIAVMVNGEPARDRPFRRLRLHQGDSVLFYNAVAGG